MVLFKLPYLSLGHITITIKAILLKWSDSVSVTYEPYGMFGSPQEKGSFSPLLPAWATQLAKIQLDHNRWWILFSPW